MKRLLLILLFALGGVGFCIGSIKVTEIAGLNVQFPALGGEQDFDIRFRAFFFGLLPFFFLFGGWVGLAFYRAARRGWMMLSGAVIGSVIYFGLLFFLRDFVQTLSNRNIANTAALGAMFIWAVFVIGFSGAFVRRFGRNSTRDGL